MYTAAADPQLKRSWVQVWHLTTEGNKSHQRHKRQIYCRSRKAEFGNDPDEGAIYSEKQSEKYFFL